MFGHWAVLLVLAGCGAGLVALLWRPVQKAWQKARFAEARRSFHRQREHLEARFLLLGMQRGGPDGLRWTDCEFDDAVAYARSRSTGCLSAFVGVTIALEDSGGEDAEPAGRLAHFREGTAVFRFDGRHWDTDGQAIFNLTPVEALYLYQRDLEIVGHEAAHRP